jgi:hypothetical protein
MLPSRGVIAKDPGNLVAKRQWSSRAVLCGSVAVSGPPTCCLPQPGGFAIPC